MLKIIIWLGLAVASWFLYWIGGEDHKPIRWFGCSALALFTLWLWGAWHWSLLICYPLMAVALNQYWDKLTRLWRGNENEYWENWVLHGLGIGLSLLPYAIITHHLIGWIAYTITIAFLTAVWSEWQSKVFWEAGGRGTIIILFLRMLLI